MESRYCNKCLIKTDHKIIKYGDVTIRKARAFYECSECKYKSWKRHLRPSSEISY